MTSNIAESFVSGLVDSYREAYIRKEIVNPQTVVSYTYVTISKGTGHRHDIEEADAVLIS